MLKKLKILFLTCILFFCTFSYVQAMDINMNITNTNSTNKLSNNSFDNNMVYVTNDDFSVSSSSLPESELTFDTILNIILIVIGILLFLLGIAIMIRLRN